MAKELYKEKCTNGLTKSELRTTFTTKRITTKKIKSRKGFKFKTEMR